MSSFSVSHAHYAAFWLHIKLRFQLRVAVLASYAGRKHLDMAELLIRASTQDAALLRRIYGLDGHEAASARPTRVVVDAHVPASSRGADVAMAARQAGVPFLVDPQTFYLQGTQHAADPWALLPYGRPDKLSDRLVRSSVIFATAFGFDVLLEFYKYPAEHWIDLRTTGAEMSAGIRRASTCRSEVTGASSQGKWRVPVTESTGLAHGEHARSVGGVVAGSIIAAVNRENACLTSSTSPLQAVALEPH
jgi:hypothetical protein